MPLRCKYLARERRPHLSVDDDGRGAVGMRVAYRYATILHRTRSRGGNGGKGGIGVENHPVEAFVQKKLAEDFTSTGTAAYRRYLRRRASSEAASRSGYEHSGNELNGNGICNNDRYKRLLIPGNIYHMKKLALKSNDADAAAAHGGMPVEEQGRLYWMEREAPEEVRVAPENLPTATTYAAVDVSLAKQRNASKSALHISAC